MMAEFNQASSFGVSGGGFAIGRAVAKIAKSVVKFKPPPPKKKIAVKQLIKTDVFIPPPVGPPAGGGFTTRGPTVEGVPLIPQVRIEPSRVPAGTPINVGFGPAGGVLKTAAIGAARLGLRLPGTRQVAEGLAGRATTLRPFFGRGPTLGQAAAFAGGAIAGETIIGAGEKLLDIAARPFGGAGDVTTPPQRGIATMHPSTGRAIATLPGVGGMLPPGTTIVKTWNTGTAQFARLADGRMAVQRKDGTIKVYRPQKHIVIPRNPRVGTLIGADKRLNRLVVGLRKVVDRGRTRRK